MARVIPDGWLREYLRYTQNQESPDTFHLWVGISIIATILDREVWFNQGYFKLYPNQYIILVAGSQRCRKSSALNIGRNLLMSLPPEHQPKVTAQKITPEALIGALQPDARQSPTGICKTNSSGLLFADELSVLIDKQARNSGLIALLVNLYDSHDEWEYMTKLRGTERLEKVYVNLLAGSSPEYLRMSLPFDEIGGGMLARTIFVYQDKAKQRIAFPKFSTTEQESKQRLITDLGAIKQLHGELTITPAAISWYENWYENLDVDSYSKLLAPYLHKKESQVLKIAQVLSVAESDSMVVDLCHLKMALAILDDNEQNLENVMGSILASPTGWKTQQVLIALRELSIAGTKSSRSNLMRKVSHDMNSEELSSALDTLITSGQVKLITGKGETCYELQSN